MTQEDKELLLKDLCARLPYGVFCSIGLDHPLSLQRLFIDKLDGILLDFYEDGKDYQVYLSEVKPYLRPMSSMTEEEYDQLYIDSRVKEDSVDILDALANDIDAIDWLNAHHFDYRGLIPKGLAISVNKNNNPYKE